MSEAHDLLTQLELAIEREQELWKEEDQHSKSVHASLGAFRAALSEVLKKNDSRSGGRAETSATKQSGRLSFALERKACSAFGRPGKELRPAGHNPGTGQSSKPDGSTQPPDVERGGDGSGVCVSNPLHKATNALISHQTRWLKRRTGEFIQFPTPKLQSARRRGL
jgi:hypothetical protein